MLCLLGTPALRVDARLEPLHLRPKALAVLAQVALRGPVPRDELAALIFPDAADPRAALRWQLAHLRARLPSAVDLEAKRAAARFILDRPRGPAITFEDIEADLDDRFDLPPPG